MARDPDTPDEDDALRWEGDDQAEPVLPTGWVAKGKGADRVSTGAADASRDGAVPPEADPDEPRPPLGNAALIGLGMLGGVYLLYTIGWIIGGVRLLRVAGLMMASDGVAPATWTAGNTVLVWLAVAAPAIWFFTVQMLTRGGRPWLRWAWLIAGVVVLIPWPMLMGGMS